MAALSVCGSMEWMSTLPIQVEPAVQALDHRSSDAGLRAIATLEAVKGSAVVLLGLVLVFVHEHAEDFAESLLDHLHVSTEHHVGHFVLEAASKLDDARLWTIVAASLTYATARYVEAWGLWHRRVWAEWFALLSGATYLPWEILKVTQRATWERVGLLVINVVIILYMLFIRIREQRVQARLRSTV